MAYFAGKNYWMPCILFLKTIVNYDKLLAVEISQWLADRRPVICALVVCLRVFLSMHMFTETNNEYLHWQFALHCF